MVHLSAGDLLRNAVKNGNTELEATMREGKLVSMEVTIGLLRDAMVASGGSVFLIDGFPRALDQVRRPLRCPLKWQCVCHAMALRLTVRMQLHASVGLLLPRGSGSAFLIDSFSHALSSIPLVYEPTSPR